MGFGIDFSSFLTPSRDVWRSTQTSKFDDPYGGLACFSLSKISIFSLIFYLFPGLDLGWFWDGFGMGFGMNLDGFREVWGQKAALGRERSGKEGKGRKGVEKGRERMPIAL